MTKILSIQDISCVGQCSLTVALPIVSAFGVETCILPSAVLSTHTGGFTDFTFRDLTDDMPSIIKHWKKENIKFNAVYSGYIGNPKQIDYILNIANDLTDDGLLIVDPAMADNGVLYKGFDDKFVTEMKRLVAKGKYVLPNITESALLTGIPYNEIHTEKYISDLLNGIYDLGCPNVILKGVCFDDKIGIATFNGNTIHYYLHEKINRNSHGTGDVYASCFVGALMNGFDMNKSAEIAAKLTVKSIKETISDKNHWYGVKFEKIIPEITTIIGKH